MGELLPIDWLKAWLCAHCMTHFTHQAGCDIPDFVMADGCESTTWTTESMFHIKLVATNTMRWYSWWMPAIYEAQASLKAPLYRAKPCSGIGRAASQLEAPFSEDKSTAFWRWLEALLLLQKYEFCSWRQSVLNLCLKHIILINNQFNKWSRHVFGRNVL